VGSWQGCDAWQRLILGGHLHYPTQGTFAGVPVSVAGALAYTMDLSAPPRELRGVDGGHSVSLVHLFDEGAVTSVVPIGDHRVLLGAAGGNRIERGDANE
jgi:hypothetical protein